MLKAKWYHCTVCGSLVTCAPVHLFKNVIPYVCGNGIREPGEGCDCGSVQVRRCVEWLNGPDLNRVTVTFVTGLSYKCHMVVTVSHDCHMTCIAQECDDPCCNATLCSLRQGAKCYSHDPCCQNCQVSVSPPPTITPSGGCFYCFNSIFYLCPF